MMNKNFEVVIASNTDYDFLVAEIYLDNKFVALISQEKGPNQLLLEFPPENIDKDMVSRSVHLDLFSQALNEAKNKLLRDN